MGLVLNKFVGMFTCLLLTGSLIGCDHTIAAEYSGPIRSFLQERREERRQGIRPWGRQQENVSVLGPNFQSLVLSYQGIKRDYLLYTPSSYKPNGPTPVVIGFHGGTTTNVRFARTTNFHKLADEKGFLVVYPNGVNKNWNDGRGTVNQDVDDVGFVTALIEEVKRLRNVDSRRVDVTGISNGAFLVQRLACERSDLIAAFSSIAGSMPTPLLPGCNPIRPVPMLMVNSPVDRFVPWNGGQSDLGQGGSLVSIIDTANFWGGRSNCTQVSKYPLPEIAPSDNTRLILRRYSSCLRNTSVVLYKIVGGGHTWPGGADQPAWLVGATSQEINATKVSWNFFKNYTLP